MLDGNFNCGNFFLKFFLFVVFLFFKVEFDSFVVKVEIFDVKFKVKKYLVVFKFLIDVFVFEDDDDGWRLVYKKVKVEFSLMIKSGGGFSVFLLVFRNSLGFGVILGGGVVFGGCCVVMEVGGKLVM